MKPVLFRYLIAGSAIVFAACNNNNPNAQNQPADDTKDSAATATAPTDNAQLAQETPSFTNVDTKVASSINEVVAHYLHVKNALADDDGAEAASGAKAMAAALEKMDHSALNQEQMNLYMDVAESLKEHAEHTADNANKIAHQREHFVMMSQDVYDLVKGFGANQPLYVAHCPMANDNKGAHWLSEKKEISNPYMGKKMPMCGTVEKVITQ